MRNNNKKIKYLCPYCYTDLTNEEDTRFGIFCPKCHHDFWRSECCVIYT